MAFYIITNQLIKCSATCNGKILSNMFNLNSCMQFFLFSSATHALKVLYYLKLCDSTLKDPHFNSGILIFTKN